MGVNIAKRLRWHLKAKGWSQVALASRAGLSSHHVWKLLQGDRPRIEAETVCKLAKALGVTTDDLLGMDDTGGTRR